MLRMIRKLWKMATRRWDAAKSDRLNTETWKGATGATINADLYTNRKTLVDRCEYEATTNPMIQGVINTHVLDVVGVDGPNLTVSGPDSEQYADIVRREWNRWWKSPDIAGRLSGKALLQQCVRLFWTNGEALIQKVSLRRPDLNGTPRVEFRLQMIHPNRLTAPADGRMSVGTELGVEVDANGRPITYWIADHYDGFAEVYMNPDPIDAGSIIHVFEQSEPNQVRGVPYLASALQTIADLRDLDNQVLDAARLAANMSIYFYTDHPTVDPDADICINESFERMTTKSLPGGWKVQPVQPTQPFTQYREYRAERQRDYGRPVSMPLMMVRLDSSGHNYSSARFDGQIYQRGINSLRKDLEHGVLNPVFEVWLREAELAGLVPPRPAGVRHSWTWPALPHVDPAKEANAESTRLQNGTYTITDAVTRDGSDLDTHLDKVEAERAAFTARGLPYPPWASATAPAADDAEDDEDEGDDAPMRRDDLCLT